MPHHLSGHRAALDAGRNGIHALQIIGVLQERPQSLEHAQRLKALLEVEQHGMGSQTPSITSNHKAMAKLREPSRTKRDGSPSPMRRALIALGLGAGLGLLAACSNKAEADVTSAWCVLFTAADSNPELPEPLRCRFSQRQGNVTVSFNEQLFEFPASEQGKTYQRDNHSTGIGFSREDDYTLVVFWEDPREQ